MVTHMWKQEPISSAQFSSAAQSCPALCDYMNPVCQASLSITISRSSHRLMSIESVMPSSHLSNARWARISLAEVRILISITEGEDIAAMHLSGNFLSIRKDLGWLVKCSINTAAGLKYTDFYPYKCILALIIKLILPRQNFFMIVSKLSPRWEELSLAFL